MSGTNTQTFTDRATRVISRCRQIAACTEVRGQITRHFLAPSMRTVHALLRNWMEAAGMSVHVDAAGNLRGLYPGSTPQAPRLIIGSHLDTVPNAGPFDGILGVVLGVTIVEELHRQPLPFAIEVVGFSEEEGIRFAKPFLGSLAIIGKLDRETLALTDADGVTVEQALRDFDLDPKKLPAAILPANTFAYLELHIEQGPVLESEDLSLGVVNTIAGQTRAHLIFTGHANHAGTTPMPLRHDAMAAAAEWITAVEDFASSHAGLVATVGKVETLPGATNVIAGRVTASLDVRHADDDTRKAAVTAILQHAHAAAQQRGVHVTTHLQLDQPAVPLDPQLTAILSKAATRAGHSARIMTSGAGHDAMILAPIIPSAMLFLRSPAGLSHHPDESVLPQDVEAAIATAWSSSLFCAMIKPSQGTPMHKLGQTRSTNQRDHLLHTPDTFVRTILPGMERAVAIVHISPAGGAAFTQYTAELEPGGTLGTTTNQRFLYLLEGAADLAAETSFHSLIPGSFAYIPEDAANTLTAQQPTRLAVIEKPYESLASVPAPEILVGHEEKILSIPLNDDPDLQVRSLLPANPSFDFAVNTMTYNPGAALSQVEVHIMEHGLLMLEGGGIYRLGDHWYPVTAGDFIWMGPYCPQWFGALGKSPAKYLIYKDWNRHPLV